MKIKTLFASTTGVLSKADLALIADSTVKATGFATINGWDSQQAALGVQVPVTESFEGGAESVASGTVRLMTKMSSNVARIKLDSFTASITAGPEKDVWPLHVVTAIPKAVAQALAAPTEANLTVRRCYAYQYARMLVSNVAALMGDAVTFLPSTSYVTLTDALLATDGPLIRAVSGLQPLDVTAGEYGAT